MLRYFRINDPYRLVGLLIIALIMFLAVFIDTPGTSVPELRSFVIGEKIREVGLPYIGLIDEVAPLAAWFYGAVSFIFGEGLFARHLLSLLIVLSQAIFLGIIFVNHKVFVENTYVPSLLYVILFGYSVDTLGLTGELIGLGFLLLALSNLLKELEFRSKQDGNILGLGFFISLASLCYFPYWLFVIAAAIIVIFYSRRDLRIFLLLLTGFALPHLLLFGVYFMNDHHQELWVFFYKPNFSVAPRNLVSNQGLFILSAVPMLFLAGAVVSIGKDARFAKYQSQVMQSMFMWIAFGFLQAVFAKYLTPQSFICLIPALSFFLAHFFLMIQRRRLAEILLWTFLIGIGSMQLLSRYHLIGGIRYTDLYMTTSTEYEGRRILVLSDNVSYYLNNQLATPFLSWELTEPIIGETGYFENLIRVNDAMEHDPPEVIIDPEQHMEKVFERIPHLRKEYAAQQPGILVRTSADR